MHVSHFAWALADALLTYAVTTRDLTGRLLGPVHVASGTRAPPNVDVVGVAQ